MFTYNLTDKLIKKVSKLAHKDRVLAIIFKKKIQEVISHNLMTIDTYKNLRSPLHEFKRIHLTKSHILLFEVEKETNHIIFVDILHWDDAYS
jgi:mRNA-degrading endonuclease RelE of RelBE toxin-antitoxin system